MRAHPSVTGALVLTVALGWGVAAGACVDDRSLVGPGPSPCKDGGACTTGTGIGLTSSSSGGDGGGGGAAQGASLKGTVVVTSNETFESFAPYAGQATVHAPLAKGGEVFVDYGGVNGTSFTLDGVASGLVWVLVQDESLGGAGVLSTYSSVLLPSASAVSLPVVDSSILAVIATNVGTFVDEARAQVILRVRRGGKALAGVSVTSVGNGLIAYDQGPGLYSAGAAETGTGGVILLFNVGPEGPAETLTLTLTDGSKSYALSPMPARIGGATLAELAL